MRRNRQPGQAGRSRISAAVRRGATTLEAALVFGIFLTLVLAMLDLGIAVFRYHLTAAAAAQGARQAIVRGQCGAALGSWGPDPLGPLAGDDAHPLAQAVRPLLVGVPAGAVAIRAEWLDGNNAPGSRVRVTVTVAHRLVLVGLFGVGPLTLQASSTQRIAH